MRYSDIGYEVQTVRLSTRPVFDDLADWSPAAIYSYAQELQKMLDDAELAFCSLGTAQVVRPNFPLQRLLLVPDLLQSNNALSATVQLATLEHGLRMETVLPTAQIIQRLAWETKEGLGNFRFAMLACVAAGNPFFPAAYHAGPASLSLGLQGASIVTEALRTHITESGQALDLVSIRQWVREGLIVYAQPVVEIALALAQEHALLFGGIDLSPAPMGADSIVSAIERCGYGPLGSYGSRLPQRLQVRSKAHTCLLAATAA
jgi:uncharacterized protein (UPF0210 family)